MVLNPSTPLGALQWVLELTDFVLIMSVNPGFGGQQFIASSLQKIAELRRMIENRNLSTLIEVDGGINEDTIADVARSGADIFVAGSAIFGRKDYGQTIRRFRHLLKTPKGD